MWVAAGQGGEAKDGGAAPMDAEPAAPKQEPETIETSEVVKKKRTKKMDIGVKTATAGLDTKQLQARSGALVALVVCSIGMGGKSSGQASRMSLMGCSLRNELYLSFSIERLHSKPPGSLMRFVGIIRLIIHAYGPKHFSWCTQVLLKGLKYMQS